MDIFIIFYYRLNKATDSEGDIDNCGYNFD